LSNVGVETSAAPSPCRILNCRLSLLLLYVTWNRCVREGLLPISQTWMAECPLHWNSVLFHYVARLLPCQRTDSRVPVKRAVLQVLIPWLPKGGISSQTKQLTSWMSECGVANREMLSRISDWPAKYKSTSPNVTIGSSSWFMFESELPFWVRWILRRFAAVSGVITTSYKFLPDVSYTFHHSVLYSVLSREEGRRVLKLSRRGLTYGTRHLLLSKFCFIYFARPVSKLWRMCVYAQSDCVETVYELPLLANNTASEIFYTNRERCEVLTGCLSLGCLPGGDWVNMWHWTNRFSLLFKQEVAAAPVTSAFSSLSHSSRRPLLEI
jgi:hypothetical protein